MSERICATLAASSRQTTNCLCSSTTPRPNRAAKKLITDRRAMQSSRADAGGRNKACTDPTTHGSISPVCIYVSLTDWPCVLAGPQGWRSCARGTATSDRDRLRASPLGGFPGCQRIANVGRVRARARAGCTPSAAGGSQTYTCGKESNRVSE